MIFRFPVLAICGFVSLNVISADDRAKTAAPSQSQWPYEYQRGDIVVPCADDEKESCIWHRLVIDNQTDDTLECSSHVAYDGMNRDKVAAADRKMVVVPHARRAVLNDSTTPEVKATSHSVNCVVRKPLDDAKLTPKCTRTFSYSPQEIFYPPESKRASEEGPALVEFSLTDKEDHPTNIVVVGSSLSQRLDESAIAFVGKYIGSTDCKQGRFRMQVTFRLR